MERGSLSNYKLIKQLGKGYFGQVYKANRLKDNKIIALKIINITPDTSELISKTQEEVNILKKLSLPDCNPFVICYYNSYIDPDYPYSTGTDKDKSVISAVLIEMELVEGKDMATYVEDLWKDKTPVDIIYYKLLLIASDVLKGLKYTHDKGIIHNDIKVENIMIDNKNVPRIIDYGLSCNVIQDRFYGKYCVSDGGTVLYVAPENLNYKIRLPASDLWALGISLYMSATSFLFPFYDVKPDNLDTEQILMAISDDMFHPTKLKTSNQQLNKLVNGLLIKEPGERLTVDRALEILAKIQKPNEVNKNILDTPEKNIITSTDTSLNYGFLTPLKILVNSLLF